METFAKLFGSLVVFVYHCFDRMVILGHMPLLTRPEHIVHFFRDVHGTYPITKEALRQRTNEYHRWVDAFARKQDIPVEWAQKGVRKEDYVLHPEEHGGGPQLPHQRAEVPHGGPALPPHRSAAWSLHALLLLHS